MWTSPNCVRMEQPKLQPGSKSAAYLCAACDALAPAGTTTLSCSTLEEANLPTHQQVGKCSPSQILWYLTKRKPPFVTLQQKNPGGSTIAPYEKEVRSPFGLSPLYCRTHLPWVVYLEAPCVLPRCSEA